MRLDSPAVTRRALIAIAPALLLLLALAGPALAHSDLVSSDPSDGAVLSTPPTTITLTFSEGLDAARSSFNLVGPSGAVGTGKAAADGDTAMTLGGLSLAAGSYTIEWTSAAQDGDILRGKLAFTVSQSTPASATPDSGSVPPSAPEGGGPSASAAATAQPAPGASAAPSAAPGPGGGSGSSGDVVMAVALGLVIVGLVGAFVLRRSRAA